jgi:hypothetical protein
LGKRLKPEIMKSRLITVRADDNVAEMLESIESRPGSAAFVALEVFTFLRRATLHELKGRFTREEIGVLAECFSHATPAWSVMCNTSVLVSFIEDTERYNHASTRYAAKMPELLDKIRLLNTAQATILQLQLWSFWYRPEKNPVLEELIQSLL